MTFKDHFSGHAKEYAQYRPRYPVAMFEFLAGLSPHNELAWDCATGNGQAASAVAQFFDHVVATDASASQLEHATTHPRITYRVAREKDSGLLPASVDLITVAQAVHWFDLNAFYSECRRVLRPDGIIAVWSYRLLRFEATIDAILERFFSETLRPYWAPELRWVDKGYAQLDFPFQEVGHPEFDMKLDLNLPALMQYIGTWSAVKQYEAATGRDPLQELVSELESMWGDPNVHRASHWPVSIRIGRHSPTTESTKQEPPWVRP